MKAKQKAQVFQPELLTVVGQSYSGVWNNFATEMFFVCITSSGLTLMLRRGTFSVAFERP